jgi:hypothetical protein
MYIHSLNPLNLSEGGNPLSSPWGSELRNSKLYLVKPTILPRPMGFMGRVGITRAPYTLHPSIPYVNNGGGGAKPLQNNMFVTTTQ